jgi:hypothetical protein
MLNMSIMAMQDPFCVVELGSQTYRSKTHTDGGKNPVSIMNLMFSAVRQTPFHNQWVTSFVSIQVWNETFTFNIINENDFRITVKDHDVMSSDDYIGVGRGQLAKVRTLGTDKQQVPIMSKKGKQHGFVQVWVVCLVMVGAIEGC